LCEWLNSELFNRDDDDNKEVSGLLKAIVAHVYFVWIHAFGDGNGRTARLMEIRFLLEAGIPSVAGHLLSNHYNKTRTEYYRQLDMASKNGGDLLPFIEYAIGGFVEQIREQLDLVKSQQWEVAWRNHVYEQFANRNSKTDKRRRDLVLALSAAESPVPKRRLRRVTGALAESYASLTEKTVTRDINAIMQMGLVGRTENGYYARKGIILQFLPRAKKETIEAQLKSAVERMTALDLDDVFIA
jgi:Fic family protein